MSSFPGGGFGDPLGSGTGDPSGGAPNVIDGLGPSSLRQSAQLYKDGIINAGILYESVRLYCPGMNLLTIETTALTAAWSTGLILKTEWSMNGIDWKDPSFATIGTTSILPNLTITGVPWVRTRVSTIGTAGDRVLVALTATKTT